MLFAGCGSNDSELGGGAGAGAGGSGGTGSSGEGGAAGAPDPDFPCDVRSIIEASCQRCHTDPPQNGAPFPLLTWEDTRADYGTQLVYQAMLPAVESDFMPLTALNLDPPVEPLTPDEKATLVGWLEAGAPAAFEGCE